MKLDAEDFHGILLNICEIHKSRCSDRNALMMGIDEPVAVLSIFRLGLILCSTAVHKNLLCKCELVEMGGGGSWPALLMNMD